MSRKAARVSMRVTRGATWEDQFVYTNAADEGIDLTGYKARLQVRTKQGQYGVTTASTLLLELSSVGVGAALSIDTPADQTVPCRVNIIVGSDETALLNINNARVVKHAYALEVFDDSQSPEYVIPLAAGLITIYGETVR